MTRKFSDAAVDEIVRLIEAGDMSYRQITKATGASASLIGMIARGERAVRGKKLGPIGPRRSGGRPRGTKNPAAVEEFTPPSGLPLWCEKCLANVQMPCVACRARAWKLKQRPRG